MLKLERASREGMISVIIRDKEYLFTRPFALAFGIALAIHLGLIILFHVAPFKIGMSNTIFPPTSVEADATSKESAIALIEPVIQTIRGLPIPPSSSPVLSKEPIFSTVHPVEYRKVESSTAMAFNHLEKEIYQPVFNPLVPRSKAPLEIIISGLLADQSLLSNGFHRKTIPLFPASQTTDVRTTYSVMVEGRTGKIFWLEPKQLAHIASIDHFSETILRDMKFATNPKTLVLSGEIELHFNQGLK